MAVEWIFPAWRKTLEDCYDQTVLCWRCRYGHHVYFIECKDEKFYAICPPGHYHQFEAYFCDGKMEIAGALLEGRLQWSEKIKDIIFKDPLCMGCDIICEWIENLRPGFVQEKLREEWVKRFGPLPVHKRYADNIIATNNVYGDPPELRFAWLPPGIKPPKREEVMLYVGCAPSYRDKEIAIALVEVLNRLGIKFGLFYEKEICCGFPLLITGQVDVGKSQLNKAIRSLEEVGAKTVITICPHCRLALSEYYAKRYGLEPPKFQAMHYTEFLEPIIKEQRGKLKEVKVRLAYQDPCRLGRQLLVYEPPREILKIIPGIEYAEFLRSRMNSWCCGAGGGVKAAYPDFALWTASERLKEAEYIKVSTIATACPLCKRNINEAAAHYNISINAMDISEIILKSLT